MEVAIVHDSEDYGEDLANLDKKTRKVVRQTVNSWNEKIHLGLAKSESTNET